jgi:hypothetical protein
LAEYVDLDPLDFYGSFFVSEKKMPAAAFVFENPASVAEVGAARVNKYAVTSFG